MKERTKGRVTIPTDVDVVPETLELVERWEEEGRIFVIRPQGKTVSRLESKPEVLEDFYQHGIEQMKEHFGAMQDFLEK